MPDICSWGTNYTFLQLLLSMVLSPYEYQSEINFGCQHQIQIQLWIHISVVPFEGTLPLWLQSHLCLTLDHVGQSTTDLNPYLCCTFWGCTPFPGPVQSMSHLISCGGVTSGSNSSLISVQPEPIVGVNSRKIWRKLHFFCLQKSFCCACLERLICSVWPVRQKST